MIYTLCKKVIESPSFNYATDYEPMMSKLDVYLLGNRINIDQYNELKDLMNAKKPVEE